MNQSKHNPFIPTKRRLSAWAKGTRVGARIRGRLKPLSTRGLITRGPRVLGLARTVEYVGGPDGFVRAHPELFATGTTSRDEGYFYWACQKRLGPEGEFWSYQVPLAGGRHQRGGAVVDFIISYNPSMDIGVRILTFWFHASAGAVKHAHDQEQEISLSGGNMRIVDAPSQDYIYDKTGRAVLRMLDNILSGAEPRDPVSTGQVRA